MPSIPKPISHAAEKQAKTRAKETHWRKVRTAVLARDKHMCRYCGSRERVEVHHLNPRSLGREDSTRACISLCKIHHAERHAYRLFLLGDDANGCIRFEVLR